MMALNAWFYREMAVFAIAYARVAPVFYFLPFLNDRVIVNAVLKNTIIFVVVIGLWPDMQHLQIEGWPQLLGVVTTEAAVGAVLGVSLALPFWIATAIGEMIDNQRGATISDSIDPATGVEASVLAPFVSLFIAAVFLQQGGMLTLMQALGDSYASIPIGSALHAQIWRFGTLLTDLVGKGIVLAAPVLVVMFLSDMLLGLLSRVCPQLNAFSLSLSVKSIVAFVIFHFYFWQALPGALISIFDSHPLSSLIS
ncbi:type III secretion system protein [Burkholderia ubonensis]|nr:type III secretion system protein [Burkholderia ubonensis]